MAKNSEKKAFLLAEQLTRIGEAHRKSGLLKDYEQEIRSALAASKEISWKEGIARCTYFLARIDEWMREMPNAEKKNTQAKKLAKQAGLTDLYIDCLASEANIHLWNYRLEDAYNTAMQSLELAEMEQNEFASVLANYVIGSVKQRYGSDDEALTHFLRSLDLCRKFGFLKIEGFVQEKLALLFLSRRQYKDAERYARANVFIQHRLKNERNFLRAQIQLVTVLIEKQKFDEVEILLDEIKKNEHELLIEERGGLQLCLGKLYQHREKFEEAIAAYSVAISIFSEVNRLTLLANAYCIICEMWIERARSKEALEYATKALEIIEPGKHNYMETEVYRLMYQASKLTNNSVDALKYLERYHENSATQQSKNLEARMRLIELETDYQMKQAEINDERRRSEELRIELGKREKELTTKTQHLIKRTEALAQFRDDLRAIIRRSPANDPLVQEIKTRLNNTPESELDWQNFDSEFNAAHPHFTDTLQSKHPMLTKMEKKICEMLRIGLTTIDMAKLLSLSERNIENHRYRIRKKIALDTEQSLHEYLATI